MKASFYHITDTVIHVFILNSALALILEYTYILISSINESTLDIKAFSEAHFL